MITMKMRGFDELRAKLGRLPEAITSDADKILEKASKEAAKDMRRSITTGKRTGRIYKRPGGKTHQASAPGEPPANDTGELVASIRNKKGARRLFHYVEASAGHARPLEFGTYKMAARPFMLPALERNRRQTLDSLKKVIKANVRKKAKR